MADNFQGDENDVILVSLVRSNIEGNIGYCRVRNRLVVAASRARCGLYFFGNDECFRREKRPKFDHWTALINTCQDSGSFGTSLLLSCSRHRGLIPGITTPDQLQVDKRCKKTCGRAREDCGHICSANCHGNKLHPQCRVMVKHACSKCAHVYHVPCPDVKSFVCHAMITFKFASCGHSETRPGNGMPNQGGFYASKVSASSRT